MNKLLSGMSAGGIALCSTIWPGTAVQAQTAATTAVDSREVISSVVVTARRREERLQDVPVTISVLDASSLKQNSVLKLEDVARVVPGFTASQSTRGGSSPSYSIRGQRGATTQTLTLEPAVGLYFDEFNLARGTGTNQTMFDLQSIQVLKGPQGTLFGRNATGGAVLITPNRPVDQFEGYAQASAGNYGFADLEGAVNIPLSDRVLLRVGGKISERDGYLHNVQTGQRLNDLDAKAARATLSLQPTDSLESRFTASYYEGGGNGGALKLFAIDPRGLGGLGPVPASVLYQGLQAELAATDALSRYQVRDPVRSKLSDEAWSLQNTTTLKLGEMTLKNIVGYRRIKNEYYGALSGSAVDVYSYPYDSTVLESPLFTEEIQLQGKLDKLSFVGGLYYYRETGTDAYCNCQLNYFTSPEAIAIGGSALEAAIAGRFPSNNRIDVDVTNQSFAPYVHVDYDLPGMFQGVTLSAGARYTWDEKQTVYHSQVVVGAAPTSFRCIANGIALDSIDRSLCAEPFDLKSGKATFDSSISWRVSDPTLLYLAYKTGYRSGGFNIIPPFLPGSTQGLTFEPETLEEVELGLKTEFDVGGISGELNVSGFYQEYSDIQRTVGNIGPTGNFGTYVTNAAQMHIPGVDVDLRVMPANGLRLSATVSIVRPKYDHWEDIRIIGGIPTPIDIKDARLPFVPYDQYSASVQYDLPLPDSLGHPTFGVSWYHQSGVATSEPETDNCGPNGVYLNCLIGLGKLPGYSLVNLRLDWRELGGRNIDVAVFVNNVGDTFYQPWGVNLLPSLGFASASIGAPRMYGVEVRVPFGAMAR